jgi:riboflavin-specific deaminase-like protein
MIPTDQLWEGLLALRKRLKSDTPDLIACSYSKGLFHLHSEAEDLQSIHAEAMIIWGKTEDITIGQDLKPHKSPFGGFKMYCARSLHVTESNFLSLYWPLCFIGLIDRPTPFVFLHMACSIDGKVATLDGDSKWIGNEENLIHAHRLRALVDTVMVGAKTVLHDNPTLTVRHVIGNSPIRLILSNHTMDFAALTHTPEVQTFLLREKEYQSTDSHKSFSKVIYYDGASEAQKIDQLLIKLKGEGINSILIEGGPQTASTFLRNKSIDIAQFHMAPLILGSGKSCINLNDVCSIGDGKKLSDHVWHAMGDTQMITARPS